MSDTRGALRQRLLQARQAWALLPQAAQAQMRLSGHLADLLAQLEPECLGLYWPIQGEFNPRDAALAWQGDSNEEYEGLLALPWARKAAAGREPGMTYRLWDGGEPTTRDECGVPSTDGRPADPDVILVPCVGFTRQGYRLGYGGGYFDRYLAAHPDVTAVGMAWSEAEISDEDLVPQAHDHPMMIIVTPEGIVD